MTDFALTPIKRRKPALKYRHAGTEPAVDLQGAHRMLHPPLQIPGRVLSLLPLSLQAMLVEPVLNTVFAVRIANGDLECLRSRTVAITVTDIGLCWPLTLEQGRLRMRRRQPDVTIGASLDAFLLLALRHEDPDTLFFERRLLIEGDTELGLQVRNVLDTIEFEELPLPLRRILQGMQSVPG